MNVQIACVLAVLYQVVGGPVAENIFSFVNDMML